MFCRKTEMTLLNRAHKRALRAVHQDFTLDLPQLLNLSGCSSIHTRHLQALMREVYQSINHESPQLMWDLFCVKNMPYNLRGQLLVKLPSARTSTYGTNSLLFKSSILWNTLPNEFKALKSTLAFKEKIKEWQGNSCTCKNCK